MSAIEAGLQGEGLIVKRDVRKVSRSDRDGPLVKR